MIKFEQNLLNKINKAKTIDEVKNICVWKDEPICESIILYCLECHVIKEIIIAFDKEHPWLSIARVDDKQPWLLQISEDYYIDTKLSCNNCKSENNLLIIDRFKLDEETAEFYKQQYRKLIEKR